MDGGSHTASPVHIFQQHNDTISVVRNAEAGRLFCPCNMNHAGIVNIAREQAGLTCAARTRHIAGS